jgi:hypothetical protein
VAIGRERRVGISRLLTLTELHRRQRDRVDWPYRVIGDWGPAGVEIHTEGDATIWTHVTDRDALRPDTG